MATVTQTPRIVPTPLITCAVDTERHVSRSGWDQPTRLFALVRTGDLLAAEPQLSPRLAEEDPDGLTAIEQEDLPEAEGLEELLAQIVWPEEVAGTAISVERIVVPPAAESGMPQDPEAATAYLAAHPDRQDVRLLVAVERGGEQVTLLRQRAHDSDDAVAMGADIAPGLVEALRGTLTD
ncbi:PPA1309 family protein [Arsenicicoccus dermatophilus]|uniref:PPA1309 family protein n=1 Tax=Arsenicicoccus dermatophilus TaxID=1076331 RepID=UPI001F4C9F4E|nr:PPA1309 family protein [Arsenicicoccus dermatophilus]MCH8613628.1 PPA1309 family protein [Arsenicicoccus dermatophilus]